MGSWFTIRTGKAVAVGVLFITTLACLAPAASADEISPPTANTTSSTRPPASRLTPDPEQPSMPQCEVLLSTAEFKAYGVSGNAWGSTRNCDSGTLSLQVEADGQWTQVISQNLPANSSFAIPLSGITDEPGTHSIRAVINDTTSNIATLQRFGPPTAAFAEVKVVGELGNVWGIVPTDRSIKVWTEVLLPGKGWRVSQVGKTNSSGAYLLPLSYGKNTAGPTRYRVVGQYADGQIVRTAQFSQDRLARPTAKNANSKMINESTNAWGTFDTDTTIAVWTEIYLPTRGWVLSQSGRTNDKGYYVLPLTYGANTPGIYTYRVGGRYPDGRVLYTSSFNLTRTNSRLDSRCLTGRVLCASKEDRKLYWVVEGKVNAILDARFGGPGHETREGSFRVFRKSRNHISGIYNVWMPYAMFFSGGQAVHYSPSFARYGYRGSSQGCINVRDKAKIEWLFDTQVRSGDKVIVY